MWGGQRDGGKGGGIRERNSQEEQERCVGWMRVRVEHNGMELEGEARLARHGKGRDQIP